MTTAYIALDDDGDFIGGPHADEHHANREMKHMGFRGKVVKFVSLAAVVERLRMLRDEATRANNEADATALGAAIDELSSYFG